MFLLPAVSLKESLPNRRKTVLFSLAKSIFWWYGKRGKSGSRPKPVHCLQWTQHLRRRSEGSADYVLTPSRFDKPTSNIARRVVVVCINTRAVVEHGQLVLNPESISINGGDEPVVAVFFRGGKSQLVSSTPCSSTESLRQRIKAFARDEQDQNPYKGFCHVYQVSMAALQAVFRDRGLSEGQAVERASHHLHKMEPMPLSRYCPAYNRARDFVLSLESAAAASA